MLARRQPDRMIELTAPKDISAIFPQGNARLKVQLAITAKNQRLLNMEIYKLQELAAPGGMTFPKQWTINLQQYLGDDLKGARHFELSLQASLCVPDTQGNCDRAKPVLVGSSFFAPGNTDGATIRVPLKLIQTNPAACTQGNYVSGIYRLPPQPRSSQLYLVAYRDPTRYGAPGVVPGSLDRQALFALKLDPALAAGMFQVQTKHLQVPSYKGAAHFRLVDCARWQARIRDCFEESLEESVPMHPKDDRLVGCGADKLELTAG